MSRSTCWGCVLSLTLAIGACRSHSSEPQSDLPSIPRNEAGTAAHNESSGSLAVVSSINLGPQGDLGSAPLPDDRSTLTVEAILIPVCGPSSPTDPACPPEVMAGVTITLSTPAGETVAIALADAHGYARFVVSPGDYVIEGSDDARGITPEAQRVTVGAGDHGSIRLTYASALQ